MEFPKLKKADALTFSEETVIQRTNHKEWILYLILALIPVFSLLFVIVLKKSNQIPHAPNTSPLAIPTPAQDYSYTTSDSSTPGWKTFTDFVFGFSIDFPELWYFDIDDKNPEYPIYYISKSSLHNSNYRDCHSKTSCIVIIPSLGGRSGYSFETISTDTKYSGNNFMGTRKDYFDMRGNLYSSHILIDPNENRPRWPDAVIDLLPLIRSEKFANTSFPDTPESQFRLSRLENVEVDKEDINTLNKILSTFRFLTDTSDWKTYRNEEYGFEIKYPDNWYVSVDNQDFIFITSTNPEGGGNFSGFTIRVHKYGKMLSSSSLLNELQNSYKYSEQVSDFTPVDVNNYKGYILLDDAATENITNTWYFIARNNNIFELKLSDNIGFPERNEKAINNQILSTFQFIE